MTNRHSRLSGARRVGPVGALLLAAAPWPASATAAPRPVSPPMLQVQQLEIAASRARTGLLMAGYRGAGRERQWQLLAKLGDRPLQRLDASVFGPQIAVGPDGTAVAAWVAGHRLRVAVARPGHGFGRSRTLATAPLDVPDGSTGILPGGVAVGPNGVSVVAWRHGDGPSAVARVAVGRSSGFAAPQTLGGSNYAPALARTPDYTFVVAWQTRPVMPPPGAPPTLEGNPRTMIATAAERSSAFGTPTMLAGPPAFLTTPPSAFTGPGGAAIVWQELADRRVAVVTRDGLIETLTLGRFLGPDTERTDPVSIAATSDGSTVAIWRLVRMRSAEDPTVVSSRVIASHREAGGAFSSRQALSSSARVVGEPTAVAVGRRAIAAWSEHATNAGARLRVRVHDKRGWQGADTVATADAMSLVRLASGQRSAMVAWVARSGHNRGRVYLTALSP